MVQLLFSVLLWCMVRLRVQYTSVACTSCREACLPPPLTNNNNVAKVSALFQSLTATYLVTYIES